MPVDYVGFAYAATVAAGGIIGYAKAGKHTHNVYDSFKFYIIFEIDRRNSTAFAR